jgi:hypothetical protein
VEKLSLKMRSRWLQAQQKRKEGLGLTMRSGWLQARQNREGKLGWGPP